MSLPPVLGRLRQVRRIGSGGFATVWLYHDDELDSPVAVKALADNWAERLDVRERFLQEARILRRADSAHLVEVFDVGETDSGTPYFVMTFADLGTVGDLVRLGRQPLSVVVDVVAQAAEGLQALHDHGVVHRDVKPQNLLLRSGAGGRRHVLVADLGVAKALLHASGLTQVVGTPEYMAPEQADVGSGLDVRADTHALGAVAYHLLTGRPLRSGGIGDLVHARLPPPPSSLAPVGAAVDAAVLRAVHPAREYRWDRVSDFVEALQEGVRAQGTTVPAPGARLSMSGGSEPTPGAQLSTSGQPVPTPVTPNLASPRPARTVTPSMRGPSPLPWWGVLAALLALAAGFAVGWLLLG